MFAVSAMPPQTPSPQVMRMIIIWMKGTGEGSGSVCWRGGGSMSIDLTEALNFQYNMRFSRRRAGCGNRRQEPAFFVRRRPLPSNSFRSRAGSHCRFQAEEQAGLYRLPVPVPFYDEADRMWRPVFSLKYFCSQQRIFTFNPVIRQNATHAFVVVDNFSSKR